MRSSFRNVLDNTEANCRRGNVSPADGIEGCFRWSTAVRALLLLLFQQRAAELTNCTAPASIQGQSGSLAASLDYALSKQPLWIIDFFGLKENGDALARQIISRVNAERKRPGPVILRLSPWAIKQIRIRILVDEKELHTVVHRREQRIFKGAFAEQRIVSPFDLAHALFANPYEWITKNIPKSSMEIDKSLRGGKFSPKKYQPRSAENAIEISRTLDTRLRFSECKAMSIIE